MMLLQCPSCSQQIDISDVQETSFQCPHCGGSIEIPLVHESTCPICCGEFGQEDSLVICPNCKTIYHSECWDENHGCSTYGCASTNHLETHNAADSGAGEGMVNCPFCGNAHASTDLVCPSCGHLLHENVSNNDDMLGTLQRGVSDCLPKLARNFKLLSDDVKYVLRLAWRVLSRYADFKGKTTRSEYLAYMGVLIVLTVLLLLMKAALVVFVIVLPACLVPTLAVTARRLRDTGLSPWMMFAIPILPLLVLVPSVEESTDKESTDSEVRA